MLTEPNPGMRTQRRQGLPIRLELQGLPSLEVTLKPAAVLGQRAE